MPNVQQWGRRESVIWPPRGYLYTLGAFFLACVTTGLFIYVRFIYGLSPLERYYLPYYVRSETGSLPARIWHLSDASRHRGQVVRAPRPQPLNEDVQFGSTLQSDGTEVPVKPTPKAVAGQSASSLP